MIELRTIRQFLEVVDNGKRQNIIYGAGCYGGVVYKILRDRNLPIAAFAETMKRNIPEKEGIPLYCLDDILASEYLDDINIILAAGEKNCIQMQEELHKRKISFYYVISDILFCQMVYAVTKVEARNAAQYEIARKNQVTIGYLSTDYMGVKYSYERLIIDRVEEAFYLKLPWEVHKIADMGTGYVADAKGYIQVLQAGYHPKIYLPNVDLIHTFNTVCDTDKSWCVSFESQLPRMRFELEKEYYLHLVECMKRTNCKALYPISENAYKILKYELYHRIPIEDVEILMKKTKVLYPPQHILISEEEFEAKHNVKEQHFIFIGRNFFRKGGREIIESLCKFEHDYEFKLTLISAFKKDDFPSVSDEEVLKYQKVVQEKTWIDYYASLPNEEVLKKCKVATIGLMPSVVETFGYAVLEMQAAGCPVVTTNIRAFPETNNEECGWVCKIPLGELGHCVAYDTWSEILLQELDKCFKNIFEQPEKIKDKGRKSLERIRKMHNPVEYQKELRKIIFE